MILLFYGAERPEFLPHSLVDRLPRGIVGRDDDGIFRACGIVLRNRIDALLGSAIEAPAEEAAEPEDELQLAADIEQAKPEEAEAEAENEPAPDPPGPA